MIDLKVLFCYSSVIEKIRHPVISIEFSATPLIRSPMGQKRFGRVDGVAQEPIRIPSGSHHDRLLVAVLPGQAQIS